MRSTALFLTSLILIASASAGSLKTTINSMNKQVSSAIMRNDMKAFEKLTRAGVTKDFVYTENGQTMDYDQMLKQTKQGMAMMGKVTMASAKLTKLVSKGNSATATTIHTVKGVQKGADKKTHVFVMTGESTDTYVKVGNTWKMSKMDWTSTKMSVDGKPMNMSGS